MKKYIVVVHTIMDRDLKLCVLAESDRQALLKAEELYTQDVEDEYGALGTVDVWLHDDSEELQ